MKSRIKAIFFDWDHTLWDHDFNARESLRELFEEYHFLEKYKIDFDAFFDFYLKLNSSLWRQYQLGELSQEALRTRRFKELFEEFSILENPDQFSDDFLFKTPRKKKLLPGAEEIIATLAEHYPLYILTNGFSEVQEIKIGESVLAPFFSKIYTSEITGYKKPHPQFFEFVLKDLGLKSDEALMIGDNFEIDIQGADRAGIPAIYFSSKPLIEYQGKTIRHLLELKELLIK